MTRALDAAIAKLAMLPADEQDRIAEWLLDELRDDEHWTRQFAASQDALSKLAAQARTDRSAGRTTELVIIARPTRRATKTGWDTTPSSRWISMKELSSSSETIRSIETA